jgi:glycosyltransferase involved in cell wall biosynthesis
MRCSYVLTVKDGAAFLERCIESVFHAHPSAELVVVDDGSADTSPEILGRLAGRFESLKVIYTPGVGRSAALNLAWRATTGSFIANIDCDDLMLPGHEELAAFLAEADDSIAVICGRACLVSDDAEAVYGRLKSSPPGGPLGPVEDVTEAFIWRNPVSHIATVVRRSALVQVGGYDEGLGSNVDLDLWLRIRNAGFRIVRVDRIVALKRVHAQQSFEAKRHLRYVCSSIRVQFRQARDLMERSLVVAIGAARLAWACVPRRLRLLVIGGMKPCPGSR